MDTVSQALLTLLGRALFSVDSGDLPEDTDWAALYRESRAQAVHLLVYDCLHKSEHAAMPPEVEAQWKQSAMMTLWNNEQVQKVQTVVLDTLRKAAIPCVLLKGSSSAMCYPKPELRCAGDIDLLVSKETLNRAVQLLEGLGYVPPEEEHHCHISMHRGHMVTELHFEPNGIPNSPLGDEIRAYFRDADMTPDDRNGLPVLPPCQRAVVLLLHKLQHIIGSGLGLRQLCDWAVFVKTNLSLELWAELQPILCQFGLLRFTEIVTLTCVIYLSLPADCAPWCLNTNCSACKELIEDLFRCGNFGKKENRYGQRLFTDIGSSNRLLSFWNVSLSACRQHWPICERYPVLLPIAPFVLLARYAKQRCSGQRPKLQLFKVYQYAGPRQKLYRELAPFQNVTVKAEGGWTDMGQ